MSAHFDFDGLPIERYYHFICKPDTPLFELLREFGLADRLHWRITKMGYFNDGSHYDWGEPDSLLRFPLLGLVDEAALCSASMIRAKGTRDWTPYERLGASDWLRGWAGARAYELLWRKLFELKFYEHPRRRSLPRGSAHESSASHLSRKSLFEEEIGYIDGGSQTLLEA